MSPMGFNKVVLSDHIHLNEFRHRVGLHSYSHLRFNVSTSVMTCVVTTQGFFKSGSETQSPPQRRLPESEICLGRIKAIILGWDRVCSLASRFALPRQESKILLS